MNKNNKRKIWGVYKILNTENNKVYIGSSKNINKRFQDHKWELNKGIHINKHLQHSWNKYGSDKFLFEIIEIIDDDTNKTNEFLRNLETKYILKFKSFDSNFGYNIVKGGLGSLGIKCSEEKREKISNSNKGRKAWNKSIPMKESQKNLLKISNLKYSKEIDVYNLNGDFIETIQSIRELSRKYKCGRNTIKDSCDGKIVPKKHIFLYHGDSIEDAIKRINQLKDIIKENLKESFKTKDKSKTEVKIDVYDSFGNFIETMKSVKETSEKYKVSENKIRSNINKRSKNFIFVRNGENPKLDYSYLPKLKMFKNSYYIVTDKNQNILYKSKFKFEIVNFIESIYHRSKGKVIKGLQICNFDTDFKLNDITVKLVKIALSNSNVTNESRQSN